MSDLFTTAKPAKLGQANGEFLGHLVEVVQGRKDMAWLRTKYSDDVSREIVLANLKHWGLK